MVETTVGMEGLGGTAGANSSRLQQSMHRGQARQGMAISEAPAACHADCTQALQWGA